MRQFVKRGDAINEFVSSGVASTIERTTPSRPRRPEMYSNQLLDAVPGKSGERKLEGTAQASAHVLVEFALHVIISTGRFEILFVV